MEIDLVNSRLWISMLWGFMSKIEMFMYTYDWCEDSKDNMDRFFMVLQHYKYGMRVVERKHVMTMRHCMSMVEKSYFYERWKFIAQLEKGGIPEDDVEIERCKWTKVYKLLRRAKKGSQRL